MNIHLLRSAEYDAQKFWEVYNLLKNYPGPMNFKTIENEVEIQDDEILVEDFELKKFNTQIECSMYMRESFSTPKIEVVKWNDFFKKCKVYRHKHDIGDNEFVVILTEYTNELNWFAAANPEGGNDIFVQTKFWDYFVGSDQRYPVAYHIVTLILKKMMFQDYSDLNNHWHKTPKGCMMDFCENKTDIALKLRTGDICPKCLQLIHERKVEHTLVKQVFSVLENIRKQMLFKDRFVFDAKLPEMKIEGRTKKIIFPELDNLEIRLTPLEKTVYLFFRNHPEGVELNSVFEYQNEIETIYSSLSNADNSDIIKSRVKDLVDPLSNSLNEKISKIKNKFETGLGEEIAKSFVIGGERGEKRGVGVSK